MSSFDSWRSAEAEGRFSTLSYLDPLSHLQQLHFLHLAADASVTSLRRPTSSAIDYCTAYHTTPRHYPAPAQLRSALAGDGLME
ncbi:hypothetical protein F503_00423 [Ophiostoma piceae UAMH 11346]|uniref:Uncharacterized protein n=1 Tax=Ophiostoma piceae (strain UAMH 11346) TaxID=1262450 RepID=S3C740_OPHP1|nr:hypothetical protein F503_00423 [Ophiostoma piceae UAMH 11346]